MGKDQNLPHLTSSPIPNFRTLRLEKIDHKFKHYPLHAEFEKESAPLQNKE